MDISAYLKKHSLSQEEFAKRIGVTQSFVSQLLGGKTSITLARAQRIVRVTKGEITAHDLLFPRKPAAAGGTGRGANGKVKTA